MTNIVPHQNSNVSTYVPGWLCSQDDVREALVNTSVPNITPAVVVQWGRKVRDVKPAELALAADRHIGFMEADGKVVPAAFAEPRHLRLAVFRAHDLLPPEFDAGHLDAMRLLRAVEASEPEPYAHPVVELYCEDLTAHDLALDFRKNRGASARRYDGHAREWLFDALADPNGFRKAMDRAVTDQAWCADAAERWRDRRAEGVALMAEDIF